MTQPTDRQLIEETLAGNERSFGVLVARYSSKVAATVINMLGNEAIAEDVGQEVFIRFFRALPDFRQEATVGTYLTRIAINLSLNELERRKKQRRFWLFSTTAEQDNAEPTAPLQITDHSQNFAERLANKEIVQRALAQLEANLRAVVVLRLIDGHSTQETADLLDIPLGTVLSRLSRAQAKLRLYLHQHL